MDRAIANKVVDFIFEASGRYSIVCDVHGVIVAAKVSSRVGNTHSGAQRMLREGLLEMMVSVEEEEASGGAIKAGCNLPIHYDGELIGSIGITGDPEKTEPVTRMASGLIGKEIREKTINDLLVSHAAQLDQSIREIVASMEEVNASQSEVAKVVEEVARLVEVSSLGIRKTEEVVATIQSLADNTQMVSLNAAIEAAHAREYGRGFAVVAEAIRKLSVQSGESAEVIMVQQTSLHGSMGQVVTYTESLLANTREQTRSSQIITGKIQQLKVVSGALIDMAHGQ